MALTRAEHHLWSSTSSGKYKPGAAVAYTSRNLIDDLARMRIAWGIYQGKRDRQAVYIYLRRVYAVVRKWLKIRPDGFWAGTALFLQPEGHEEIIDPYAIDIYCSGDKKIVYRKM